MPTVISKPGESPRVHFSKEDVDIARKWAAEHDLTPEYVLENVARVALGAPPRSMTADDYIDHPGKHP